MPFFLPRREVAATKFTGGNVPTQLVGVKRSQRSWREKVGFPAFARFSYALQGLGRGRNGLFYWFGGEEYLDRQGDKLSEIYRKTS